MEKTDGLSQVIEGQMLLVENAVGAFPMGAAILNTQLNALCFNEPLAAFSQSGECSPGTFIGKILGCTESLMAINTCGASAECRHCPIQKAADRAFRTYEPTWRQEIPWPNAETPVRTLVRFSLLPLPYRMNQTPLAQLIWEDSPRISNGITGKNAGIAMDRHAKEQMNALKQTLDTLQQEISESRRAEAKLRESEKRYRYSVENSPNPIFSIDSEGYLLSWNKACERTFQYPAKEAVGMRYHRVFDKDQDLKAIDKLVNQVLKGHKFDDRDFVFRCKDGSLRHTISRLYPLKGHRRKPAGCVVANTDVTVRRQAEEAQRQSELELRMFSKRLIEVQEKERKKIGAALHDRIVQNLIVLKISLERQRNGVTNQAASSPEQLKNLIAMIQQSIEQIRDMIMTLRPTLLDDLGILATIHWLCQQYQSVHPEFKIYQKIDIRETDIPGSLKTVIFRVIEEAFDNIVQHSGADRVRLILKKANKNIVLGIEDNGVGFDEKTVLSGLKQLKGVGLPSMKERISISNGSFEIKPAPGQGTAIYASWPGGVAKK